MEAATGRRVREGSGEEHPPAAAYTNATDRKQTLTN